jgi:soluble lytic murein transglycosylase-like protein
MQFSFLSVVALGLSYILPVSGAVLVHLRNGAEFEAQTQVSQGESIQFLIGEGTVEFPASEVERTEVVADPPLPSPTSSASPDRRSVAEMLQQASRAQAVPLDFLRTVAHAESGLQSGAVSRKGAVGLMQLMPATAAQLGIHEAVPAENALGGAMYLRELLLRYHGDARLALAAYNAGPAAVERYGGVPPYPETVAYVNKVLREYAKLQRPPAPKPSR